MLDVSHEFDRTIGMAIARGLSPGPWRAELERRFVAARFAGDEAACRRLLEECGRRIEEDEAEKRSEAAVARRAAEEAECRAAAARMSAREVIEAVERDGWHRLALRPDGAILIAGGMPAEPVLCAALERNAGAIRALLGVREEWSVAVP
jgi:hypothetical protein